MRRLIVWLLFLIASVWVALEVIKHAGYLIIVAKPWTIEMPLWFAAITALLIIVLLYWLIVAIDRMQFSWYWIKNWFYLRKEQRFNNKTQQGLALLIEGRWQKAERLLLSGVHDTVDPLLNYLGAAKAAQELGHIEKRNFYLQQAEQRVPAATIAIGLTKAELQCSNHQWEEARGTLMALHDQTPRHPQVLHWLEKVLIRLADWSALIPLLPKLKKANILTQERYLQFEKNLYSELLSPQVTTTWSEVEKAWQQVPRLLRKQPDVVYAYVKQLVHYHHHKEAEELIRKTIKHQWHAGLVEIYGTLPFVNLNRQLVIVGAWLKMYGQRQATLLTLARLCVQIQLWGKAKDYFEKCLALGPNAAAALDYGRLLEQLNESETALAIYRNGIQSFTAMKML